MDLQYISDISGNHVAVIIPIEQWNTLTAKHQDLKGLEKPLKLNKKLSDFRGAISKEVTKELLQYVEQSRKEWDRDIF